MDGEMTDLDKRTLNAIAGWLPDPLAGKKVTRELVAAIPYRSFVDIPNIGPVTRLAVVAWLAEDGLAMPGTPEQKPRVVTQARLDAAAELLRKHGYKVTR